MIGYHYTSWENWLTIRETGLRPYHIEEEKLSGYFPGGVNGTWMWRRNLRGWSHLGTVLYQASSKASTRIVKLKCRFPVASVLSLDGMTVKVVHRGKIGNWLYHEAEPAFIVMTTIPPGLIEAVGDYDLLKRLV
jgi:hypothetical protein